MNQALEPILPRNEAAERTILGCAMLDNTLLAEAVALIGPQHFADSRHRVTFAVMLEVLNSGTSVDLVTLTAELARQGRMQAAGGYAYLSELMDGMPRRPSVKDYCAIVRETSILREAYHLCEATQARILEGSSKSTEILAAIEQDVLALNSNTTRSEVDYAQTSFDTLNRVIERANRTDRVIGMPTGVPALDEDFCGYVEGELTTIGARPRVGKTSMVASGAVENLRKGVPTIIFSLEMSRVSIDQRLLVAASGVPAWKVQKAWYLTPDERQRLRQVTEEKASWPLTLIDAKAMKPEELISRAKLAVRRDKCKLGFIDFFTRMDIQLRKGESKMYEAYNRVTKHLADFASGEGCAMVLLSQIGRPDAKGTVTAPTMEDLRATGGLEENSNNVLLLHRPWDKDGWTYEDEIIIAKQREGESMKTVPVRYSDDRQAFGAR